MEGRADINSWLGESVKKEERDKIACLLFDLEDEFYEISEIFKKLARTFIKFEVDDSELGEKGDE